MNDKWTIEDMVEYEMFKSKLDKMDDYYNYLIDLIYKCKNIREHPVSEPFLDMKYWNGAINYLEAAAEQYVNLKYFKEKETL